MPEPETQRQANSRVYEILDEIHEDLSSVKTDVAVLASSQPRLVEVIADHETRLRKVEAEKASVASVADLAKQVSTIEAEQNRNSWLPRLGWAVLWLIVGGVVAAVLYQVITH